MMNGDVDKPEFYWVQDSGSLSSMHVNDGRLNFQDSLIGYLVQKGDKWRTILKDGSDITDPKEGLPSIARARMHLEEHFAEKHTKKHEPVMSKLHKRDANRITL